MNFLFEESAYARQTTLYFLLGVFLFLCLYDILLLLVLPILRRFFSAKVCAVLWIVPVFVYYQSGLMFQDNLWPWLVIPLHIEAFQIPVILWGTGFVVVICYQVISHLVFRHRLLAHAREITDEKILSQWIAEQKTFGFRHQIPLVRCGLIRTPLSMGAFERTRITILPEQVYTEQELRLLFRHELHHIQRCDVETKVFLGFCQAFGWFFPMTWTAVQKASEDLELSCDEIVLRNASESERRQYAELLLKSAGDGRGYSTCLSANATALRYRLKKVMHPAKQRIGIFLFAVVLFFCFLLNGSVVFAGPETSVGDAVMTQADLSDIEYIHIQLEGMNQFESRDITEKKEDAEFIKKLQSIPLQKLYTSYSYETKDPYIYISLSDKRFITITDECVSFIQFEHSGDELHKLAKEEYYAVQSELDWAEIIGLLEMERLAVK
ncbi:MAG: M56 family metallopeptidase [Lachnospiraceae bacterium]|nr:M56 family metallopeptidase [Lachnospiraceae bacterium]